MNVNLLQREQKEWSDHNFGEQPAYQPLLGIVEEVGELCHAHLKQEQGIRTGENHIEGAIDVIGDVVTYLAAYCNSMGFDLQSAVDTTWEEVKKRDWKTDQVKVIK